MNLWIKNSYLTFPKKNFGVHPVFPRLSVGDSVIEKTKLDKAEAKLHFYQMVSVSLQRQDQGDRLLCLSLHDFHTKLMFEIAAAEMWSPKTRIQDQDQ